MFTNVNSVEHNNVFCSYAADTYVNASHNGKWEDKIPAQQTEGVDTGQICQMVVSTVL